MDGKYGRLFTEGDVKRLLEMAVLEGAPSPGEQIASFDEKGWLTFSADEPLFLLRGQDEAAPATIGFYSEECERVGASAEHIRAAQHAGGKLLAWQAGAGREHVKAPD